MRYILALALLLFFLPLLTVKATSPAIATVFVAKDGDDANDGFSAPVLTIARAAEIALADGAVANIAIGAGVYAERVFVPRAGLTYSGAGDTVLDGGGLGCFETRFANTTVSNLELTNCYYALSGIGAPELLLEQLHIHNSAFGIYVADSPNIHIRDSNIHETTLGECIMLSDANFATIERVEAWGCVKRGIYLLASRDATITASYVHDAPAYGFEVEDASDNVAFFGCWAANLTYGFIAKTSRDTLFEGAVAWGNTLAGFYFKAAIGPTVAFSDAYGNGDGVRVFEDNATAAPTIGAHISGNIIAANRGYAIATHSNSVHELASEHNDFYNNAHFVHWGSSELDVAAFQQRGFDIDSLFENPQYSTPSYGQFIVAPGALAGYGHSAATWDRDHYPTRTPLPQRTARTTPTVTGCAPNFSDVLASDYFAPAVRYLYCAGVISGYADGHFKPYANTTRAQLAKMIVLGLKWETNTSAGAHFSDVSASNPFYPFIETAYMHGAIAGYADHTFRPYNNVTRAQLAKIVVLATGWVLRIPATPTFGDVRPGSTFYPYIETAAAHGVISGYSNNLFLWQNNATRGQIAKIVYLAIGK